MSLPPRKMEAASRHSRLAVPAGAGLCLIAALALLGGFIPAPAISAEPPASGNSSEKALTNPNGACLELRGVKDMVLENRVIGPCGGNGIEIWDSENIMIAMW
jgi:hypothetical protein